jgi:hypothetical protein
MEAFAHPVAHHGKDVSNGKNQCGNGARNFIDGQISVEQFSKTQNEQNQSQMEYETKKNEI